MASPPLLLGRAPSLHSFNLYFYLNLLGNPHKAPCAAPSCSAHFLRCASPLASHPASCEQLRLLPRPLRLLPVRATGKPCCLLPTSTHCQHLQLSLRVARSACATNPAGSGTASASATASAGAMPAAASPRLASPSPSPPSPSAFPGGVAGAQSVGSVEAVCSDVPPTDEVRAEGSTASGSLCSGLGLHPAGGARCACWAVAAGCSTRQLI